MSTNTQETSVVAMSAKESRKVNLIFYHVNRSLG